MDKLLALGEPEIKRNWLDCAKLGIGTEHVEELIGLALDEELNSAPSDSREVWVPVHAWRALGRLHAASAAEPLVRLLDRIEAGDDWVREELPRVFGMIGPPAIPPLSEYLRADAHPVYSRVAVAHGLQCIGADHPEVRDEVVAILSSQLAAFKGNDPDLNGFLISHLIDLHAVESASLMKQAFDADSVELFVMGDWEDAQIELGLKSAREKPPRPTPFDLLLRRELASPEPAPPAPAPEASPLTRQARRKAEREAAKERKR
jgi:HEAT repeat protein